MPRGLASPNTPLGDLQLVVSWLLKFELIDVPHSHGHHVQTQRGTGLGLDPDELCARIFRTRLIERGRLWVTQQSRCMSVIITVTRTIGSD